MTVPPQNTVSRADLGIDMGVGQDHDDEGYVGPQHLHDVVHLSVQDDAAPKVRVVSETTENVRFELGDGGEKDTRWNDPRKN